MRAPDARAFTPPPRPAAPARQLATFQLAGLLLGIDVLQVLEVLRPQPITPVPLAPPFVEGLLNLRGQLVTAIDLRRRLNLAAAPGAGRRLHAVVRAGGTTVSLLVDAVGDVVHASESQLEPTPPTVDASIARLVTGVCALDGGLLLVLDVERAAAAGETILERDGREGHPAGR